jgi:uncharacterized damage-inducible protein DinB
MSDVARTFLDHSRTYLSHELLPRIRSAVAQLPEEDLWWRPNEASNSIGNLILHLCGNLHQWVVCGVGGLPDDRDRQAEFDHRDPIPAGELMERLERTVAAAVRVMEGLPLDRLLSPASIQGRDTSAMGAIYHAVEHFSMHTGQIAYIAKLRLGKDLGFYRIVDGVPRPAWERRGGPLA